MTFLTKSISSFLVLFQTPPAIDADEPLVPLLEQV
jgi:hypothetical protein